MTNQTVIIAIVNSFLMLGSFLYLKKICGYGWQEYLGMALVWVVSILLFPHLLPEFSPFYVWLIFNGAISLLVATISVFLIIVFLGCLFPRFEKFITG